MGIERGGCNPGAPACQEHKENWNNCVAWNETSSGKHDDWCRNDHGHEWSHVGQDGAGCSKGFGKGVCRRYVYKGPNCDDSNSDEIWDGKCDGNTNIFPNLQTKRKEYCNSNIDRARSNNCSNWCNANGGQCGLRDRLARCAKYGISDGECNDGKITDIESKCVSMGFIDQTTKSSIGGAQCNQGSIDAFLTECRQFIPEFISGEGGCTSQGLADAKSRKQQKELADKQREQAAKDAEAARKRQEEDTAKLVEAQKESDRKRDEALKRTSDEQIKAREAAQKAMEQTLLSVVDPDALPDNLKDKVAPKKDDNTMMYIIIAVVVCLLLCSSLIGSFFLLGGKED